MSPLEEVVREIERLRRLAASVHVRYPAAEATRAEVGQFFRDAGLPVRDDLVAYWLAGEGFVLMTPATGTTRFEATPFRFALRGWQGFEQEVRMHFGPQAGQVVTARARGSGERGLVLLGSDGSGDALYLALRDATLPGGAGARAGQVLHYDHELDTYAVVADGLAAFLRASNDLVERDPDRAFFYGDAVDRIFQFPGLEELHRQLDAGLSPDHARGTGPTPLLGEALDKKRDDVFNTLLDRGADVNTALVEACHRLRLDLAEAALGRGADPAVRLKDGRSLLASAALGRRPRTVALLTRHGARDRLPAGEFDRVVAEVRGSDRIDDRKRRQVLEALGQ